MVATLCASIFSVSGQNLDMAFENTTADSLLKGTRVVDQRVALDNPIVLTLAPQNKVSGYLVVSTLYNHPVHIDKVGWDPNRTFDESGRKTYIELPIGESVTLHEERCFTFQYWDWNKQEVVDKATTLCLTQEFVDLQFEAGDAWEDLDGIVHVTRPLRTARGRDEIVHASWINMK